jgi:tetrapyrrole methylase family protein/MazG family protein
MPKNNSSKNSSKISKEALHSSNSLSEVQALVEIVARLREPGGCPWDQEQTHKTLARYTIEEAFEMVEALEERESLRETLRQKLDANPNSFDAEPFLAKTQGLDQKFKDELGDVLFQVLLHARLAEEDKAFNFFDVVRTLSDKLVRRHPHVFANLAINGLEDVFKNWEQIKKAEKATRGETAPLISVPIHLPALQRAHAIGQKTQKLKFDWAGPAEVWLKVKEEIEELQEAMDNDVQSEIEHELGDVLFSVAQLARHYEMDPEQVLRTANSRFLSRFEKMVGSYGRTKTEVTSEDVLKNFGELSNDEKEKFWEIAKKM